MTVLSNGYIVTVNERVYGPYINYDDATRAHEGDGDRRIQALNYHPDAVKVMDCDRSECRHCRSVEREGRKALARTQARGKREAASE
jgi:hypothetical protein